MTRWLRGSLCVAAVALIPYAAHGQTQAMDATGSCGVCHSKIRVAHVGSAHAESEVTCVVCHGGNPNDMEKTAMAPSYGFSGEIKREDVPTFCASCHADVEKMRPYGLPPNQYEAYLTSQHGQKLEEQGDTDVAVCSDCHGTHDILPGDDPRSSVYRKNLPDTCAKCHGDEKLMKPRGLAHDQFEGYQDSLHGVMVLRQDSEAAPTCASCHGNHGAHPPGAAETGTVCAQCHAKILKVLQSGAHELDPDPEKGVTCVFCHGNHRVKRAELSQMVDLCLKCHQGDDTALETGRRIVDLAQQAELSLAEAQRATEAEVRSGHPVAQAQTSLEEAYTSLFQAPAAQHSLRIEDVEKYTYVAHGTANEVLDAIAEHHRMLDLRKFALIPLWIVVLAMVIGLQTKALRLERQRYPELYDAHCEEETHGSQSERPD